VKRPSVDWFARIDDRKAPNVKQYLRGLRKYYLARQYIERPYNYYLAWLLVPSVYIGVKYIKHNLQLEYDRRKHPNMFIPEIVYRVRRMHYVYWEISRLSRGLPKTFTYSTWDDRAKMMYHVDLQGNMVFEKLNLNEERIDLIQNPLLGPLLRRREQLLKDDRMTRRANKLAIYYFNVHKRYDLDVSPTHLLIFSQNYLLYKPITPMDLVRCVYYLFMYHTGLADSYRNEQYLPKPDFLYDHERMMLALNFNNPDKE